MATTVYKFKEDIEPTYTDDPCYALLYGGYIEPSELLEDASQADEVDNAVSIVLAFLEQAEAAEAIELG